MSAVGSFLKSRTSQHIFSGLSSSLNIFSKYSYYHELQRSSLLNSAQYGLAKQSAINTAQELSDTLYQNYLENYSIIGERERSLVGKTEGYFASRGVEIFGSAVQDMMKNIDSMEKTKMSLYENYVRQVGRIDTATRNQLTRYSLLQSGANRRARHARLYGALDIASTGLSAMQNLW